MFSALKSYFGLGQADVRAERPPLPPPRFDKGQAPPSLPEPNTSLSKWTLGKPPPGKGKGSTRGRRKAFSPRGKLREQEAARRREEEEVHRRAVRAVSLIKHCWRAYRRIRAAVLFQALYRGHAARVECKAKQGACLRIQAFFRGHKARIISRPLQRQNAARRAVAMEFLQTERSYLRVLIVVQELFVQPLQAHVMTGERTGKKPSSKDQTKGFPSEEQLRTIFSSIELLLGIHTVLLEKLEERLAEWHPNRRLGSLFLEGASSLVDSLKLYTIYVNNYDSAVGTLRMCLDSMPEFTVFVQQQEREKRCKHQDLESLLINPIQRLPRYVMLFQDLIKHTWEHHPDFSDLQNVLEKMRDIATFVNERKREAEAFARVCDVQSRLVGKKAKKLELICPHRKFVREGPLIQLHCKKDSEKEMYVFLFSDVMVPSKKAMKKKRFNAHESVRFGVDSGEVHLRGAVVLAAKQQFAFKVREADRRTSRWRAETQRECEAWMRDIQSCIDAV